jgi:hypothetical protein
MKQFIFLLFNLFNLLNTLAQLLRSGWPHPPTAWFVVIK